MSTKRRILIIDNEREIQAVLAQFLSSPSNEVLQSTNRDETLKIIAKQDKQADLTLIVDVVLHGESGVDVANECAGLLPNVRIIFISGYASDVLFINDKIPSHHVAFLQKPFTKDELLATIEQLHAPLVKS